MDNGYMNIPYNPAGDPWQYVAQGLGGMLQGWGNIAQQKQAGQEIRQLAEMFGMQMPAMQSQSGQHIIGQMLGQAAQSAFRAPTGSDLINQWKLQQLLGMTPEQQKEFILKPPISLTLGQPASPTERQAIASGRASLDALDNLKTLFDSTQTKTGPIVGRLAPTKGLFGLTTDEQEAFMAATSAFKNAIIKEITGAQMSEQEANRIMKQVPDITDPPTRWQAKWQQSKKNLEMMQKRRMEILQQSGLRAPTGQIQPSIPQEILNMSDEELKRIAGIK